MISLKSISFDLIWAQRLFTNFNCRAQAVRQARKNTVEVYLVRLERLVLHMKVPHLYSEVVSCHQVASAVAELHVRDGRDDFREEGASGGILWLLKVYA